MADANKFIQLMKDILQNTFKYLGGTKNASIIITCALSIFKGIFRPIFTMMDKKQDPEAKKYAAFREGLTELIAIPLYIAVPLAANKLAKNVLKTVNENANKRIETNTKFIGTCLAALIIPFVCNIVQPPIMEAYKKHDAEKKAKKTLDVTSVAQTQPPAVINKPANQINTSIQKPLPVSHSGMRVGN